MCDSSFDREEVAGKGTRRFEAKFPGDLWQMDVTYVYIQRIPVLYLVVIVDDYSRYCTTKPKFLAVLARIFHRGDAEHAETENAETTDFTDGPQWTRAFAVPQGRRCAPFI